MARMGVHVSIAGGLDKAAGRAKEKGCDVFQIFSSNPRGWKIRPISDDDIERFAAQFRSSGLDLAVDHMPYLPNLSSPRDDVYIKSIDALATELMRCETLGIPFLVTHLGSHLGAGWEQGLQRIVGALDLAFSRAENDVVLLLENTAGTKNSMGGSFQEIAAIINSLQDRRGQQRKSPGSPGPGSLLFPAKNPLERDKHRYPALVIAVFISKFQHQFSFFKQRPDDHAHLGQ